MPDPGPYSFNFMQFLGKFGKIVCWRPPPPPLGELAPDLEEILDPPLCTDFSQGVPHHPDREGVNLLFDNCMKIKEFGSRGTCPSAPFGSSIGGSRGQIVTRNLLSFLKTPTKLRQFCLREGDALMATPKFAEHLISYIVTSYVL